MQDKLTRVVAAVLLQGNQVLLAQRPPGKAYAGYWEFPGGKVEPHESLQDALARELHEELGITVQGVYPWLLQRYRYPHAFVELNFFRVTAWQGELHGRDGQALAWQTIDRYTVTPLLPANTAILRALTLPDRYGITMASELGRAEFLKRAQKALEQGLRLIQIREKNWPETQQLIDSLLSLAAPYQAKILLNSDVAEAARCAVHGVHLSSTRLLALSERPRGMLCAASCHNTVELAHAESLGLDFAVLSPVLTTASHPGEPLGWQRFADLIRGLSIPVYALGGLQATDREHALTCGAQGVAMRSAAWG